VQESELVPVQATDELSVRHNTKRKRTDGQQASGSSSSSLKVPVPNELSVKVKKINENFDEVTKDWRNLNLKKSDGRKKLCREKIKQRLTTSLVDEPRIHGRKKEKEDIIKIVLSENAHNTEGAISVLVITGLGGIGKTTIAQLTYNDPTICQAFDMKGWVCVPENTGVEKLTRSIIVAFSKMKCSAVALDDLQRELKDIVKEKRFLLVLDDVWNEREVD
jgi:NB-ARC domain